MPAHVSASVARARAAALSPATTKEASPLRMFSGRAKMGAATKSTPAATCAALIARLVAGLTVEHEMCTGRAREAPVRLAERAAVRSESETFRSAASFGTIETTVAGAESAVAESSLSKLSIDRAAWAPAPTARATADSHLS